MNRNIILFAVGLGLMFASMLPHFHQISCNTPAGSPGSTIDCTAQEPAWINQFTVAVASVGFAISLYAGLHFPSVPEVLLKGVDLNGETR